MCRVWYTLLQRHRKGLKHVSDFYKIKKSIPKPGIVEIFPDFQVRQSRDMMTRGGKFYAIWDEETGLWSTSEYRLREIVDADILACVDELGDNPGVIVNAKYMANDSSGVWNKYRKYANNLPDNFHQLDEKIVFSDTEVRVVNWGSLMSLPLASVMRT